MLLRRERVTRLAAFLLGAVASPTLFLAGAYLWYHRHDIARQFRRSPLQAQGYKDIGVIIERLARYHWRLRFNAVMGRRWGIGIVYAAPLAEDENDQLHEVKGAA